MTAVNVSVWEAVEKLVQEFSLGLISLTDLWDELESMSVDESRTYLLPADDCVGI